MIRRVLKIGNNCLLRTRLRRIDSVYITDICLHNRRIRRKSNEYKVRKSNSHGALEWFPRNGPATPFDVHHDLYLDATFVFSRVVNVNIRRVARYLIYKGRSVTRVEGRVLTASLLWQSRCPSLKLRDKDSVTPGNARVYPRLKECSLY